jgi:hypothetical protein
MKLAESVASAKPWPGSRTCHCARRARTRHATRRGMRAWHARKTRRLDTRVSGPRSRLGHQSHDCFIRLQRLSGGCPRATARSNGAPTARTVRAAVLVSLSPDGDEDLPSSSSSAIVLGVHLPVHRVSFETFLLRLLRGPPPTFVLLLLLLRPLKVECRGLGLRSGFDPPDLDRPGRPGLPAAARRERRKR